MKSNMLSAIVSLLVLLPTGSCKFHLLESDNKCDFHLERGDFDEFESHLPRFRNCTRRVENPELVLRLDGCHLPAFPATTFSGLGRVQRLLVDVSDASRIRILLPQKPSLFENSTFGSVLIHVSDLQGTLAGWRWSILAPLHAEEGLEVSVVRCRLPYLHPDFGAAAGGRVTLVRIVKSRLRWLGRGVFAPLSHLTVLELRENLLESIERSHLPTSARSLVVLDLGKNLLSSLPDDLFEGLNLASLLLDGNRLKITEPQANDLVGTEQIPLVYGAPWPCECILVQKVSNSYKTDEDYFKDLKCHTRNGTILEATKFLAMLCQSGTQINTM